MKNVAKKNIGIGYKVFNPDWTCKDFQYEVGKEYYHKGELSLCNSGFHFCPTLIDCFNYYDWDSKNKVAVVHYDITKSLCPEKSDKYVTSHIKIVKEISWEDVMRMCNSGIFNTGNRNSGDRNSGNQNSGNWNSGDRNSGNRNSGDRNSGDRNSGNWNSGDRNSGNQNSGNWNSGDRNSGNQNSGNWNSGDRNSGNWNSGDRNSGNRNSGNWNSGDRNSGDLNSTNPQTIRVFNKPCSIKRWETAKIPQFFYFTVTTMRFLDDMTDEEKLQHPEAEITGGYLKTLSYTEAFKESWKNASTADRLLVKKLPNFNNKVFFEISGIDVEKELKKSRTVSKKKKK